MPINGVRLNVEVVGTGPPILALHGFTGDLSTWADFVNDVKSKHTVILVDLLGHGSSDSPSDPRRYQIKRSIDDLIAILDKLRIGSACWLGYSMGGRLALIAAILSPARCSSLIIESGSPGLLDMKERRQRARDDQKLALSIEEHGIEQFVQFWERLSLFESQTYLPPEKQHGLKNQRLMNRTTGLANTLRGASVGKQSPVHAHLSYLCMPSLFIAGMEDTKFRALSESMAHTVPKGEYCVVKGSGHNTHLEQPAIFSRKVLDFLRASRVLESSKHHNSPKARYTHS